MSNPRCCTACNRPTMQPRQGFCPACQPEVEITDPEAEAETMESRIRISRKWAEDPADQYAYLAA